MVKIQIKSEKLTSFGGILPIMEKFDRMLSHTIDSTLGLRSKVYGYQYSEIIRSLMCVYFCGGSCVEDVSSHLMETLCLHPHLRTCRADTILRAIRELTTSNQSYRSDSGKSYDFNVASDLNNLLVNALLATGQLLPDNEYDFDFLYRQCLSNALEYTLFHICTCPLPDLLNNTVVFLRQFCITQQNDSDSNKEYMVNPHCPNPQFYLEQ